jgi:5-methylcytosine-specific restriction endonuclease McrA
MKSEEYEGSGNPMYIDGESKQRNYGKGWKRAKKKALERDNYKCVICNKSKEELGKNPSVHHKIPVRKFGNPQDAHYLDNLVCLCEKHHPQVEYGNRKV